jgi:hypothetical protein
MCVVTGLALEESQVSLCDFLHEPHENVVHTQHKNIYNDRFDPSG